MIAPTAASCVLRFRCPDRPGILALVTPVLAESGWDIREASVHGDEDSVTFFVRVHLASETASIAALEERMAGLAGQLQLDWEIHDLRRPVPVLIAVSKFHHCLVDLIHKTEIGALPIRIVGVVSNHETARSLVEWHGLPFHHLPVDRADKGAQEARFLAVIRESGAELTVLARYMQILSPQLCDDYPGQIINIHHSFLPSFVGAKPYHQAYTKGVKLIGATCHYVTSELDQGPIIEQDVIRVDHSDAPDDLVRYGKDIEKAVLARGLRYHLEDRVLVHGNKTVVFR